jgi:hypothetical protein
LQDKSVRGHERTYVEVVVAKEYSSRYARTKPMLTPLPILSPRRRMRRLHVVPEHVLAA